MNEYIFFTHLLICAGISLFAQKLGKEGLLCSVVLQPILANLFVLKQITLFGFSVTCSDVYAVGAMLGANLLQEHYGKESAKKAVWLAFLALFFFVAMASLHLLYIPNGFDTTQSAYQAILEQAPRLVFASLASFFIVQRIDLLFFGFLKKRLSHVHFGFRNCISLTVSQALDTLLFTILGLWGLVSNLIDIFIVSFLIKASIACMLSIVSSRKVKAHDLFI